MVLDNFRTQRITWDKANRKVYENVRVSSEDENGRKLAVQIVNDGVVEDLTGFSLSLAWETRDKVSNGLDAFEVVDISKGQFAITYKTGMLQNFGNLNAQLVLIGTDTSKITSENFTITVFGGVGTEGAESSNEFSALTTALATVNQYDARIESKADKSTTEQSLFSLNQQLAETGLRVSIQENKLIGQEDVSEEFLRQFVENTQPVNAVPADYSLTQKKFKDPVVIGKKSKNLFNKNDVTTGHYVSPTDGLIKPSPGFVASGFIPVQPNTNYTVTGTDRRLCFYSKNQELLGHLDDGFSNPVVTPGECFLIRMTTRTTEVEKTQLEVGTTSSPYVCFGITIDGKTIEDKAISESKITQELQDKVNFKKIPNGSISSDKLDFRTIIAKESKNLFDKETVTDGYYISNSTGTLQVSGGLSASGFIPINAYNQYTLTGTHFQFAFYEKEDVDTYISGVKNNFVNPIQPPLNANYVRLSMSIDEKDIVQFEKGSIPTDYEPFGYTFPELNQGKSLSDKSFLFLGDSITATESRWVKPFVDIVKPKSYKNVAVTAATWRDYSDTTYPYDGNPIRTPETQKDNVIGNQVQSVLNNDYLTPDIIMIAAGTNDNMNYPPDTDNEIEMSFTNDGQYIDIELVDRKSFAGAMRWCVEKLSEKYPLADIIICTPIQCSEDIRLYSIQKQKVDIIKEVANRMSCHVINSFVSSGIYGRYEKKDEMGRDLKDGVHPNDSGGKKLGRYVASQVIARYNV